MILRQPRSTRTDTLFPYSSLFRSPEAVATSGRSRRGVSHSPVLGTKSMEQMLWDAACQVRGEKDAPKFKDYLLPLLFIKRLSDVFDDEVQRLTETYGDRSDARRVGKECVSTCRTRWST